MADHVFAGLRCFDVLEQSGAFVLGALEPAEADSVRRHLAECPEAHAEIAELGGVVPALFEVFEPVAPSATLRQRILAAAAADLGRTPGVAVPGETERTNERRDLHTAPATRGDPATAPLVPEARSGRGFDLGSIFRRPAWAGLAMAAGIAALALGAWNVQLRDEVSGLTAYRAGVQEVLEEAARPGAQLAILSAPEADSGPSGLAAVGADGSVALVMRDLAPTAGSQVYEAWLIGGDGTPVPIGDFAVGDSGSAALVTGHVLPGDGVTVALTLEAGPGAQTPTLPIVALGTARAAAS